MSTIKRIILGFTAFALLLGVSFGTVTELTAQKASAQEQVGWTEFPGWIGHGEYAASKITACRQTVNTAYGPMYKVTAVATGSQNQTTNYLMMRVWRDGRYVASSQSNAWFWGMVITTGHVSMNNGDAISLEMGYPGNSSGTGRFLPFYLKLCPF